MNINTKHKIDMKTKHLISFLAKAGAVLSAITWLTVGCGEDEPYLDQATNDSLTVTPSSQKIGSDGSATFTFSLMLTKPNGTVINLKETNTTATISFEATGGTVSPSSATTDENGRVTVTFTTPDPESFTGGTVKGTVKNVKGIVDQQGNLATATAEVLPLDAVDPPVGGDPIKQAEALQENTYSVQKTGGKAQVFTFPQEYSDWYVGTSYMDGTQQAVHMELMDEDAEQMTMGWFTGEIPPAIANKLTTISQELYNKYPWISAKLGTMRLGQDNMLDCHMGNGGNVKTDGSSQIWLREKTGTKAYSGQYQLLFVFVFENAIWDQETETYLPGEEYTICGNAILEELVADLSYFSLNYESGWVAPGQSITLSAFWTPGASFDWSNVKLDSQTCAGQSGEWFSWDASTQTLYAKKSADNKEVNLTFSYAGTNMTDQITLYNGPGYTSFGDVTPKDGSTDFIVAENDPQGWSSNDNVYIRVGSFTPDDGSYYSSFNYHSIELDPASDHYNELYYNDYGPYIQFKHTIPEGDFNIILRSRANHDVKCTVPVKMVRHKVTSFQIQPESGATVAYNMGLALSVETTPEDAYWDWALVELDPSYEDLFLFQGHGGRDDHPKLFIRKSYDSPIYGTQVKFRLKYDHDISSYIYVTMD